MLLEKDIKKKSFEIRNLIKKEINKEIPRKLLLKKFHQKLNLIIFA